MTSTAEISPTMASLQAESDLLGCVIKRPELMARAGKITMSHFTNPVVRMIWGATAKLYREGRTIDVDSVHELVEATVKKELVEKFAAAVVPDIDFPRVLEKVCDCHNRRLTVKFQSDVLFLAQDPSVSMQDLIFQIQNFPDSLTLDNEESEFEHAGKSAGEALEKIANPEKQTGLPTHISLLNAQLKGGFQKNNLYILAGLTSHGKTTMALNFASRIAITDNHPLLFVTLELSKTDLATRLLHELSGTPNRIGGCPIPTEPELYEMGRAKEKIEAGNLYFIERSDWHIRDMRNDLREFIKDNKIEMVIVDHLLKLDGATPNDSRARQIAEITAGLKKMAMEMQIPVLALTQFNREGSKRGQTGIPTMADLKESSSIEHDAQGVIFVHQWSKEQLGNERHKEKYKGNSILVIAKNYQGERDFIMDMAFRGEVYRFAAIERSGWEREEINVGLS